MKHIIVIGAGFGGLKFARKLNNTKEYTITLIDRNNFHQFQPLFYQVATAGLDASNISFPLRNIFRASKNVRIRVEEVTAISTIDKTITTPTDTLSYDYLVLATGATTNFFNNETIKAHSFPMKSTAQALQLRNQIIGNLEEASRKTNVEDIKKLLTIVIVGGGPTGVELSGALSEMRRDTLPKEYPEINFSNMVIYLLEGSPKLLGNMSQASSESALGYLNKMGVVVKTSTVVKDYIEGNVILQDGSNIGSHLVIWAAGVKGTMPEGLINASISKSNLLKVDEFNKVIGYEEVYAIGDIASMESKKYPRGFPQLANVAIDQAKNLADNFMNQIKGKKAEPFEYFNKGSMATIGRNKAVVDLAKPKLSFQGFFAWFIWMTLHLFLLIGFKNKIIVFINWIYKYITHNQSLSLWYSTLARRKD
ncbi:MAG: NAD(P)/FAD-dependent oxidoreductase [Bacteroidia bacterium]|nr:NAD(P)/FAD-dependent oxidoreductase [Bacteroidia bacterium]